MSLSTKIKGAWSGLWVEVEPGGYLRVITAPYTTVDSGVVDDDGNIIQGPRLFPWNGNFTLNNDGATTSMLVNGSLAVPQPFVMAADNAYETWVTDVLVVLADAGISLWTDFGNAAALTNGVRFHWRSPAADAEFGVFRDNFQMAQTLMFGRLDWARNNVMRGLMSNIIGSAEGLAPMFDLKRVIPPNGLQLRKGTEDQLIFEIRDNLTTLGLDAFYAVAYGFRRVI